ncbi:glycerophosphodiester phosphodiesterase [Hymenobacter cellulosilyticus]|uniref:glycerophosphodiester phosphodiesterase n=1 Tax=Hymenobacter cellulosilyticus TaxID=2932248 RepID=A0A8T9QGU6_9BACT|nr:glycerophosphodiester phosphodiesterase [Hymenobacter cellulosilyticus]UOQ74033.1 glycerophosphodiester phosphodiesterase [Hymenobacter cellulosilyticus]
MKKALLLLTVFGWAGLTACQDTDSDESTAPAYRTLDGKAPLIIAHRGASGLRPEHTLEAYQLAIDQGADYIESDVVLTKDQVLVCRHEPMLSGTTNVAELPQFAGRKTTKMVDGVAYEDWFASDFTLAEIKMLRAKQAMADRSQQYNGQFLIPTFQEVIDLAKAQSTAKGRVIGVYPETKHPTFHEQLGLPLTDKLLAALTAAGWNSKEAPVYVQSFEVGNLRVLHQKSPLKLVQLLDADDVDATGNLVMKAPYAQPYDFVVAGDARTFLDLTSDAGLDFVKTYAVGIGPWKPYVQPYTPDKKLPATSLIERAHQRGLFVHAYTFRDESRYLLKEYNNDPKAEYQNFYALGLDGVFTDYTATAVAAKQP